MDIFRIDHHDDEQFERWFSVFDQAYAADHPEHPRATLAAFRGYVRGMEKSTDTACWVAADGDTWMGAVEDARPLRDNRTTVLAAVAVHPDHRRRGIGAALVDAVRFDATRAGRRRLITELPDMPSSSEAGRHFLESLGASPALATDVRSLRPPLVRTGPWMAELEEKTAGYQIVSWEGAAPEWAVESWCELAGRLVLDAPMGDLDYEPEVHDADRLRETEATIELMERRSWCAGAAIDDRLVAMTQIVTERAPDRPAYQWDTVVAPEHRGHRLGLAVKLANHRQIDASGQSVEEIWTYNATANGPMIRVNELLGFELRGHSIEFQMDW